MDTKKLRQKILDLAIHGKLVPQDPNDEPASVLLERIRAEKERLIAEGKIKRSKKSATSDTSHYENVPFEVPDGWSWTSLNSVCTIFGRIGFRGYTKDDLVDSTGAITLSPSNIVDGVMNFEKCTYISWEKYEESPEIQVQNEDVLLVKTGSSYGKCAYVESLPKEATINPQFVVLKFIGCNPRFLTCCLQSNYARKQYEEFVLGTAIPTFTQVALGAMAIPMPPIEEQERIVAEVEKLLTIVDNIEQSKQDLSTAISQTKNRILDLAIHGKLVPQDPNDEPAIELLKHINPKFTSCDNPHYENNTIEIPKNWEWVKLSDIAVSELGKTLDKGKNSGTPHNYLCAFNVKWCSFDFSVIKKILLEDEELERYKVRKGDLLICEGGDVGRAAIWESDQDIYYQNALHRVRFKNEINQYFYLYVLQYYKSLGMIDDVSGGVTIKHFTQNSMKKLSFPLPPIKEQYRIVSAINQYNTILDDISANL